MSVKRQLLEPRYKAVGERLRSAREGAGLTQAELGTKVGLTQKQISTLEGGKQLPMAGKLPLLVQEVGGTIDWLLAGKGKPPHPISKAPPALPITEEGTLPVEVPAPRKKARRKKRVQGSRSR